MQRTTLIDRDGGRVEQTTVIDHDGNTVGYVVLNERATVSIENLPSGWVLVPLVDAPQNLYAFSLRAVPAVVED